MYSSAPDLKDPIPAEAANHFNEGPLNAPGVAWQQEQCSFAQVYQTITGTRIEDRKDSEGKSIGQKCGPIAEPGIACQHCQQTPHLYVPFERTREVPLSIFNESNIQQLRLRSFCIPSGERLLIFPTVDEANQSPWKIQELSKTGYVGKVPGSDKSVVCVHCCRTCHTAHLAAGEGVDPALFCNKLTRKRHATPQTAALGVKKVIHPQTHGQPDPDCFVFGRDQFPVRMALPDTVLVKTDQEGKPILNSFGGYQYYSAAEIVVFFDDLRMPFEVVDGNVIRIDMNQDPFGWLYRPNEFHSLLIKVVVYLNNRTILYSSNLSVFMNEEVYESRSTFMGEADQLEAKGVVAHKRFQINEHIRLSLAPKEMSAFDALASSYLRGSFLEDEKARAQIISIRNKSFTQTFRLPITEENRKIKIAWFNAMLNQVSTYYLAKCANLSTFRDGLLQILDFYHALNQEDNFTKVLNHIRRLRAYAIWPILREHKSIFPELQKLKEERTTMRLQTTRIENEQQKLALEWEVVIEIICQLFASNPHIRNEVYQKLPANVIKIPAERLCTFHFNRFIGQEVGLLVVFAKPYVPLREKGYRNRAAWDAEQAARIKAGQIQEPEEYLSPELLDAFAGLSISSKPTAAENLTVQRLGQMITGSGDVKDAPSSSSRQPSQIGKRQRTEPSAPAAPQSSLSLVPGEGPASREAASTGRALLGLRIPLATAGASGNGMESEQPAAPRPGPAGAGPAGSGPLEEDADSMDAGPDKRVSERPAGP